ncbi:MAG: hypothetical protein JWL61_1063 [Gemmatimonadetes bacterium]|jgi:hypothetical protein|nr:hypothetical protein [Gemmatimonadota bacterium]
MHSFVGKRVLLLAAVAGTTLLGACKDKRVKAVDAGITRDSLLTVLSPGSRGSDSLPNVYRTDRYLIDGKTYEIFYFSGTSQHLFGPVKDTLPWKELTPIVMVDRMVMGKDWAYLDSISLAHKIPVHKRD